MSGYHFHQRTEPWIAFTSSSTSYSLLLSSFSSSFFLPPYLIFKLIRYILRSFRSENVAGKVVLITGASSGIGEERSSLSSVARREDRLSTVADKSRRLGSPDVLIVPADVSKPEDCKIIIDKAVEYFGCQHEFLGFGIWNSFRSSTPEEEQRQIIVIASIAGWIPLPKHCFYNAAKAALISFYETLRVEFGSDIGITIAMPGLIYTDLVLQQSYTSEVQIDFCPGASAEGCAKSIVASVCRGDAYLTEPLGTFTPEENKGKIIVIASIGAWMPIPRNCFYSAAKAALISFYDTLRVEFGSDIGVTIVTPGLIYTDMVLQIANTYQIHEGFLMGESAERCAKSIVASACRGDAYLTEPSWYSTLWLFKMLCPELLDSVCLCTLMGKLGYAKKTS
ncbi:putative Hydroxysteroid dehydrogenase 2 [Hibiscus syriacus]|uniref:Hydroxysteroid dehydrogenase 2 n=1 Tax=Hibiscus syriacus TaxID=106335 RepID=A0A6A3ASS4_HIBSY|nr:putative Hydroxysteroid dehydrogenase 2 [Hibiscus syriacus]